MTCHRKNTSRSSRRLSALVLLLALLAAPAAGDDRLRLDLPVDCRIPDECMVQSYFDHEGDEAERDSGCGPLSYDGHRGIDFAVPDLDAMRRGVPVLAAAAGTVLRTRDGEPDVRAEERRQGSLRGREAGNSVLVDHGKGWRTQYSHLRAGSVRVRAGDHVAAGAVLGLVGQSGNAAFPHLHFEVRRHGRAIDPFTGPAARCGDFSGTLWQETTLAQIGYRPSGLVRAGFAREAPKLEIIRAGGYREADIPRHPATLAFWAEIYGLRKGDRMRIRLESAEGEILAEHEETADRHRARQMWFTGARRPQYGGWPGDRVTGHFELIREEKTVIGVKRVLALR